MNSYDRCALGSLQSNKKKDLTLRAQGPSYLLKKFHNDIKGRLIQEYTVPGGSLLDVGCGRGGDIHKWSHLHRVIAFDRSAPSIAEARRRNVHNKSSIHFVVADSVAAACEEAVDAVSCMFALTYLDLDDLFREVHAVLKPGGVFFGVVTHGDRVRDFGGGENVTVQKYSADLFVLQIPDTVVDGANVRERYVTETLLKSTAERYNFEPVLHTASPGTLLCLEERQGGCCLIPFAPRYPTSAPAYLTEASQLYAAFAFRKIY